MRPFAKARRALLAPEAPAAAVASVQPYQTVDGSALTVQFHFDPERFPFQHFPMRHPGVVSLYQRLVIDRYLRFLKDPRLGANAMSYAASNVEALQRLSRVLTTEYTTYVEPRRELHPAWGSVELVRTDSGNLPAAHRLGLAGLNVSLWDSTHGLLASSLLTGAEPTAPDALPSSADRFRAQHAALSRSSSEASALFTVLPDVASQQQWDAWRVRCGVTAENNLGGNSSGNCGGGGLDLEPQLLGDLRRVGGGKGFAHHIAFGFDGSAEHGRDEDGAARQAVAPWVLDQALTRVATRVCAAVCPELLAPPGSSSSQLLSGDADHADGLAAWSKDAINAAAVLPLVASARNLQVFDLDASRPLNVAMAPPRVWPVFHADRSNLKLGEPAESRTPVVAVKLRLLQDSVPVGAGTIAFTPFPIVK